MYINRTLKEHTLTHPQRKGPGIYPASVIHRIFVLHITHTYTHLLQNRAYLLTQGRMYAHIVTHLHTQHTLTPTYI